MVEVGETDIVFVVAPVFHKYVPPPPAASVVLCPLQIVNKGEAEIVGVGDVLTEIFILVVSEQVPLETITE